MSSSFAHLRAVVTGSSSGIGRAIALELARRSASSARILVHFNRNEIGARDTAEQIRNCGAEVDVVAADLRVPADRTRLVEHAWRFLEAPTTWINNAGVDVLTGDLADADFATKFRMLMETDVIGTVELTRALVERLVRDPVDPPASITFIGWDQAPGGMEGEAGQLFGPVKAAVMAFANSLAQEVAPKIRVNTVAPGWIQTAWGSATSEYWDRRAKEESLMNRWGTPADVAAAVCYAADPANTFCTGQLINVNGGWNRRYRIR